MATNEESCTHDCSTCSENCSSRSKESLLAPVNEKSHVKHVIGVVSGKGGVGKSLVTGMLSVLFRRRGYQTAVLDADVTGPSVPQMFGLHDGTTGDGNFLLPAETKTGIKAMSVNLLLEDERSPVIWRGPVIGGTVKQFWTDVVWGDIDWMFVDMPPGTGDVALTVFQSLPIDGLIIVTSPQELVSMIVAKAVNMAKMMDIPVLGLAENMSYAVCPHCGEELHVFGDSHIEEVAQEHGLEVLARIPMDPKLASLCDNGMIEQMDVPYLDAAADYVEHQAQ